MITGFSENTILMVYAPGPPLPSGMRPGFRFFYPGSPRAPLVPAT